MKIKFNEAQFGNISVENQEKLQITIPDILTNKKIRKNNDAWTSDSDVQKSDFGTIYSYFFVHNCKGRGGSNKMGEGGGGGGQGNYLNFIKRGVFLNYSLMMIKCSRDSFSLHNRPPSYPSSYDFTQKSERLNSCKSIVEKML